MTYVKYGIFYLLACIFISCINNRQEEPETYFGEEPPGLTAKVFAPGIVSKKDRYEFGCTMSKDGRHLFFGVDNDGKTEIYSTSFDGKKWSTQVNLFPGDSCGYNDPMLSMDEERLYFISNRPLKKGDPPKDIDIWYVEREDKSWSDPINVGPNINNHLDQYYCSFTKSGDLYYSSKDTSYDAPRYAFDIYKSIYEDASFGSPTKLASQINSPRYEADVFVAPDESYLIFCSIRKNGFGEGDLYISFKNHDNEWSEAISMGPKINSVNHELCPYVTRDGKYLFYTSNKDIYWVGGEILDSLRTISLMD